MIGIRRDRYGHRVYVKVRGVQREARFPPDATLTAMRDKRAELRRELKLLAPMMVKGSVRQYAEQCYLPAKKQELVTSGYKSLRCEVEAWYPAIGALQFHQVTRARVLEQRTAWLEEGYAKKTCNHRVRALRGMFHYRFGRKAATPCDDIDKLEEPAASPRVVSVATIQKVLARLGDPKVRARFMVLVSTGQRPAQLKRAAPDDVDLRRGVWMVRPAKRGNPIPVILTDDMRAAFRAFKAADAWGYFDGSDYAKALYAAGWPRGVRPYNAKHTVAITLAEQGAEWEDIRDWFGQKDIKTTRIYTGLVLRRTRATAARLQGRLGFARKQGQGRARTAQERRGGAGRGSSGE